MNAQLRPSSAMTSMLALALALSVIQPALAQDSSDHSAHAGHQMPPPDASPPTPDPQHDMEKGADDHAGHEMPDTAEPVDHSSMDHSQMDHGAMDHGSMDHSQMDHGATDHAAMDHSQMDHTAMDHSAMEHGSMDHSGHAPAAPNPPVAPPPPGAFSGPQFAADAAFDPADMARARAVLRREHGGMAMGVVMVDRLEARMRKGRDGYAFEADAWYGGDIDRLWLKANGEGTFGGSFGDSLERVELQALWSHAIGPWFNLQAGVRQDLGPDRHGGPERTHAVAAINGLAPYFFEVEGALFLSTQGELTMHAEAEYDQRLTQRLILQPAVGLKLSAQSIPELGLGSGLTSAEAGLRLRYEIAREFAPYVGVQYEHSFGETARLRRAAGEDSKGWSFLLGVRAWF